MRITTTRGYHVADTPVLFEYLDYRAYLRDRFEAQKRLKSFFSYRYISGRVGINPGFIVKLFQGKVHLGVKNIPAFANLFGLQDREREYFTELVHFGRARHDDEVERRFERLQAIKGIRFRTVADGSVEFFRNWYHMAMRTLLMVYRFDGVNYRALGSMLRPTITTRQARESIALLERLRMIQRASDGAYQVTDAFISTGERWTAPAIRDYQKKTLELAIRSIDEVHKDLRDISTVTMTFALNNVPALREQIREFRQRLLMMSQENGQGDDCVMQVNMQVFPVALVGRRRESRA